MKKIIKFSLLIAFIGCGTTGSYIKLKSTTTPKNQDCEQTFYMPGQEIKENTEIIGYYSVQETGFSVICSWEAVLEKNRAKSCEVGADIIQFTEVDTPSIRSTCYRAKANFLKIIK